MAEHAGEKTEQATPKRLEQALKKGQFARSAEVQTVFVLTAGLIALRMAGTDAWQRFAYAFTGIFTNLHKTSLAEGNLQVYLINGAILFAICVGPVVICTTVASLLAGGIQSRFTTASDALEPDWNRVNPASGFEKIFSPRALVPTGLSILKIGIIAAVCWSALRKILQDPIFYTAIQPAEIARFLADTSFQLGSRVILVLVMIAGADYGYQYWRTNRDLMMTKEELKEEIKNTEGDPRLKARQRRRRRTKTQRQMLQEVPKADVVLTNPTHLAIALRYDRKTMKAPKIVAKGSRLNALKIREVAVQHRVPIMENKPLARLLFKHGRVGGEIPAELYAAVAEVLAWVYRVNRFRYYSEQTQN
ncbi:MAG TPA: EscU/YscU/HrcU family type III secretion system export apparatus switch protein [Verrucomicrobiae bacterium]|jgi:flagellar biosynthetic protein FlhB|nr:EscU/YscU/HrcU family type III secretion system export apparatus switch protein [Verrucomicrobiae bacterium]